MKNRRNDGPAEDAGGTQCIGISNGQIVQDDVHNIVAQEQAKAALYAKGEAVLPVPLLTTDSDHTGKPQPPEAAEVVVQLLYNGKLPCFLRAFYDWSPGELGNAHEVSLALMLDLITQGRADGWTMVTAQVRASRGPRYSHSWVEYKGWAVDAANCLLKVFPARYYRKLQHARKVVERDAAQTREFLRKKGWHAVDAAVESKITPTKVRVYDFVTKQTTEIPADELAPGMVAAHVQGIDGTVWVDATQVSSSASGEYRQPPFPPEIRKRIEWIAGVLREVQPMTIDEWVDGFRCDMHADWQIFIYECIAKAYLRVTDGRGLSKLQKAEYFHAIVQASMCETQQDFLGTVNVTTISKYEALRAAEALMSVYRESDYEAKRRQLAGDLPGASAA